MSLESSAIKLGQSLCRYQSDKQLLREFFERPDSITYVPESGKEFAKVVSDTPKHERILYECEDRFAALIQSSGKISIGSWGAVRWVEYVEPSNEEIELGWTGLKRINFVFANFKTARGILEVRGVPFIEETRAKREQISVYPPKGDRFALVDKPADQLTAR